MTLLCFGDSNTWGYDPRGWGGDRYDAPWPELLEARTGHRVLNCGENGRTIPHTNFTVALLDRLLTDYAPDKLLLMLGSNDLLTIYPPDPRAVTKRMELLLEHLNTAFPTLPILLIAPMGLGECYRPLGQWPNVTFASVADWRISLAFDGLHFDQEGHRQFADAVKKLL